MKTPIHESPMANKVLHSNSHGRDTMSFMAYLVARGCR